ncbi:solute:Na+ symporter, SSS family [Sporobacter termitidis DSM 10068]|uniref:Solute:Na+ symporter, SSS family n=1 Tax=Sporobacter termitidis DSM 10068 TaxID=1123282 RepID=A0A1M5US90_9FIRM|nr:sodium:solute symporter family protein [Sporobacter termitidis]SHH65912.1 solute:Na+ symporter, SSS family [Sporobacter termitidis DSM 10068]
MTTLTVIGIFCVLALIIGVGILSSRKVKDEKDFINGGGKAGSLLLCGAIMGSLVSSQATIGTAQLAFNYGLAAWWFTLGAGIGCLFLAVVYVRPLRRSSCMTELQVISEEYGALPGKLGSVLCSIGIFISVLAQVVACAGLITVLFPQVSIPAAAVLSIAVMCVYVIFGGSWGAGMGGVVKLILLCIASIAGLIFVLVSSGGVSGLLGGLKHLLAGTDLGLIQKSANGLNNLNTASDVSNRFVNLIARGAAKDLGSGLSLVLGVLSTQTYAQAIWCGKSDKVSRRGALLSACLIPPIGIAGTAIGLFMRAHYITQAEVAALANAGLPAPQLPVLANTIQVFPSFLLNHMPHLFAGIVLGTLFISVVGGGAGLSLGMATIMVKDIFNKITFKNSEKRRTGAPRTELLVTRCTIAGILLVSAVIAATVSDTTINDMGFLSMGLRAAVVFVPLSCALFLRGRINQRCALLSIVISPLAVIFGSFLNLSFDPLFLGLAVALLICAIGYFIPRKKEAVLQGKREEATL